MVYLAARKTNLIPIYDWCIRRPLRRSPGGTHALFLDVRGAALQASPLEKPSVFLRSPFHIPKQKQQKQKKPRATFTTPALNYTAVIKQHAFNHSLCADAMK